MDALSYEDFDLQISKEGLGYKAQILSLQSGQASQEFAAPLSDAELEEFLAARKLEAAKTVGDKLFKAVFQGELFACFRRSVEAARQQGKGLRLRLHLTDVPELASLPWEFLYDHGVNRFLALSDDTPVVRYLALPERIHPLEIKITPLRILVAISGPCDQLQLQVEEEWSRLQGALAELGRDGLVTIERLEQPTLGALQRRLRRGEFHILHFVGHGGFDPNLHDWVLIFETEEKRSCPVSGQDLGVLLHDHHAMRLAVLNACEGARSSLNDPFSGTAQSLMQQGIPAVIAMQFAISDASAITFAQEFYQALADNYPVDAALAEARKAMSRALSSEWGTPVLYMRSPDGRVFDVKEIKKNDAKQDQGAIPEPVPVPVPVPVPPSLAQMLPGRWDIQISTPSVAAARLLLDLYPNGFFQGQLMGPMGTSAVAGQWQITAPTVVVLQGQERLGFITNPYCCMIQFNLVTPMQFVGVSSIGEQVLGRKVA